MIQPLAAASNGFFIASGGFTGLILRLLVPIVIKVFHCGRCRLSGPASRCRGPTQLRKPVIIWLKFPEFMPERQYQAPFYSFHSHLTSHLTFTVNPVSHQPTKAPFQTNHEFLQMHTSNDIPDSPFSSFLKYQMRIHSHQRYPRNEFNDTRCDPEGRRGAP